MKRILRRRRRQAGFTLIELMISLVLFSFAVAGVLAVAVSMVQGYKEQREAIAAEAAARLPMDFLADALRQASPGVTSGQIWDNTTCTSTALSITNSSTAPDKIDVVYASGGVLTSTKAVFDQNSTSITVNDASQLAAGDQVVVSDYTNGNIVKIISITGNVLTVGAPCNTTPAFSYAVSSLVIRARHATFFVSTLDGIPTLMFDPDTDHASATAAAEPLAEGIEDLQVALAVDSMGTANHIDEIGAASNDDDWVFNRSGDTAPVSTATIRAMRVSLVARATQPVLGNVTLYNRPALEDRAGGSADAYRRRVLRARVELRNISGSP